MSDWKNDRAEMEMRNSGKEIERKALIEKAIENGKLPYTDWLNKYWDKDPDHNYWTNIYEKVEDGMAPQDLSRWREDDLEKEYMCYIKGIEGDSTIDQYKE